VRFYFAARFSHRFHLRNYRRDLVELGHYVTSRWIDSETDSEDTFGEAARTDYLDVLTSEVIVSFTELPRCASRGARHCEFGVGLAMNKRLIVIGPREHVFHYSALVERFDNWDEFFATLT
jgi:hypothetical protein